MKCVPEKEKRMQMNDSKTQESTGSRNQFNMAEIQRPSEAMVRTALKKQYLFLWDLFKYLVEAHRKGKKSKCPFLFKHKGFFAKIKQKNLTLRIVLSFLRRFKM